MGRFLVTAFVIGVLFFLFKGVQARSRSEAPRSEGEVQAQLHELWGQSAWVKIIGLLEGQGAKSALTDGQKDALYAAYINHATALASGSRTVEAVEVTQKAAGLMGERTEAGDIFNQLRAGAEYLDPRELTSAPKSYVGRNITLQGRTLTVTHHDQQSGFLSSQPSHSWVQVIAQVRGRDDTTESVVVKLYPKDVRVLKDECYKIYGVVAGTEQVQLVLTGASHDAPVIRGYTWDAAPPGRFGFGCAGP